MFKLASLTDILLNDRVCALTEGITKAAKIFLTANAAALLLTYGINTTLDSGPKTVVFANSEPGSLEPLKTAAVDFFMYVPITMRQTLRGNQVVWKSGARVQDIIDNLKDPTYESAVFVGHGSGSTYQAADGTFYGYYHPLKERIPLHAGELIQQTCGSEDHQLRQALLMDPTQGYQFSGRVTKLENYLHAWTHLIP